MMFLILGAVSATDSINVSSTEDSNLISDNDVSLSAEKLEISSEDSISETNIVNSHDDNLGSSSDDDLQVCNDSQENNEEQLASNDLMANDDLAQSSSGSSTDSVVAVSSSNGNVNAAGSTASGKNVVSAKTSSKLSIIDTHYAKSATYLKVTLKDKNDKAIKNQKISLKLNGKTYTGVTNKGGVASIKTATLTKGTYTVSLSYAGNSNYAGSSLSKKIKVLSSVIGSDLTKYYGESSKFKATFWKHNIALANAKVSFTVNGKTYTRNTDKNGVAKLSINLAVGKYSISITNPYSHEKVSKNIVVKKDNTTLKHGSGKTFIIPSKKFTFKVTLKSQHDVLIKNQKVSFTYDGKTVTAKTDANGKASITIPVLAKGTHSISYKFKGDQNYYSSSGYGKLIVKTPTTKLFASSLKMEYNDGSKFTVKLTDDDGKVMPDKTIRFYFNGKNHYAKTDDNGIAKLTIKNVKPGTHKIYYAYSQKGLENYNYESKQLIVSKSTAKITAGNLVMKYKDGSSYIVTVKDKFGKPVKGAYVNSTLNGRHYIYETNSQGIAKLKITQDIGYYKIKTTLWDKGYNSNTLNKHILVNGTKFIAGNKHVTVGNKATYSVKLVDGKNNPIKNTKVSFTVNGKTTTIKSNYKGVAKIDLGVLSKGKYTIKYKHGSFSGSSKLYVVNKVTVKQLISSAKDLDIYVEKNGKLPSTVKVGDVTLPTSDYMYLLSKAIVNLKSGSKAKLDIKDVKNPSSPKSTGNLGKLKDYISVAKSLVKTADSKGKMPNSVSSKVGTIGYKSLVYSLSLVLESYGDDGKLPSSMQVKKVAKSSTSDLNGNLKKYAAYLAATKNCQVNNAKIKALVAKLTKNCRTDKQKATAIFNYVRDTLSYSFYYNTRYGAVGTLNAKTGNCVDHAHLLVAMFRAAKLPTKYGHGKCTFSSGGVYGHVWAKVLINNKWTVADATSSRNSLGKVANWNTHSYVFHGYFASISF